MSFIRTVLGDIPPGELGVCYAHEHVVIDRGYVTQVAPHLVLDSVENGVRELEDFRRAGGRAMVDAMPGDAGRNGAKLVEISRRSGVHLLAATGLHLEKYYPPDHWRYREDGAARFVGEIERGIEGGARAGVIKIASGPGPVNPHERLCFEGVAEAHRRTGAPVLVHTEPGRGLEQAELLRSLGVDPGHTVLSHTDREPDPGVHRAILETGVNLEYDRFFRWKPGEGNPTVELLRVLLPEFPRQLLLGTDGARPAYWRSYGGAPGLDHLITGLTPLLEAAGITERRREEIFVANPARVYAFRTRK